MTAMRCPECKSLNDASAAACMTCGLILLNAAPKRRAEDGSSQRRRAADQSATTCQFCNGEVPAGAVRCRHCSEVINDDFYRERAQQLRSRINYASWVAYLLGLVSLLFFRPVGLLSIAAGLLLSIIYYAIPVEPPSSPRNKRRTPFWVVIRRQLKMERVPIPIPAFRKMKLIFVGTPLIAALVGYSANLLLLQQPMDEVLKENAAFSGMKVSAHYEYWVVPGVVVYDLQSLGFKQTPIDVHTAFLEFAKQLKEKRYSRVDLSYQGTTKFSIDGAAFQRVGEEYAKRNFDYALYTFPRLLRPPSTDPSDRDALLQFHRRWYGEDKLTKTVANGL